MTTFSRAQQAYDNQLPPSYYEDPIDLSTLPHADLQNILASSIDGSDYTSSTTAMAHERRLQSLQQSARAILSQWPHCEYCDQPLVMFSSPPICDECARSEFI